MQKRPFILRSLRIVATPYHVSLTWRLCMSTVSLSCLYRVSIVSLSCLYRVSIVSLSCLFDMAHVYVCHVSLSVVSVCSHVSLTWSTVFLSCLHRVSIVSPRHGACVCVPCLWSVVSVCSHVSLYVYRVALTWHVCMSTVSLYLSCLYVHMSLYMSIVSL